MATERNEASGSKEEDTEDMWIPEAIEIRIWGG